MRKLVVIFSLLFLFTGMKGAIQPDPCAAKKLEGGSCIQRDGKDFIEENAYHFRDTILYQTFLDLEALYNAEKAKPDPELANTQIAGYSFIPIATPVDVDDETRKFFTSGIRVVLTLWKWEEDENGVVDPRGILFFGFGDNLSNAYTIKEASNNAQGLISANEPYAEFNFPTTTTSRIPVTDERMRRTREFDLIFLDKPTLVDLATGTRFYTAGQRVDSNGDAQQRHYY